MCERVVMTNPDKHRYHFTADLHLGHESCVRWELDKDGDPLFSSAYQRDNYIIYRWNKAVRPTDTVYVLGDFSFRNAATRKSYIRRLNGHLILVPGNHDYSTSSERNSLEVDFHSVLPDLTRIRLFKQKIVLCHYPMRSWRGSNAGVWHLHGHSHGNGEAWRGSLDVGIMCNHYAPVSFSQVEMRLRNWEGANHHADTHDEQRRTQ